jgi:hypothetical protein
LLIKQELFIRYFRGRILGILGGSLSPVEEILSFVEELKIVDKKT